LDRRQQLVRYAGHPRRDADRRGERANLVAVAAKEERARTVESLRDRVGARRGIAVRVSPDPASEAERSRRVGNVFAVAREQRRRRLEQALLEEPVAVADLVRHTWAPRADLVGLPERRHLRGEPFLHVEALA